MFGGIKIDKYDAMFSLYVRARDKFTCQRCKSRYRPPKSLERLNKGLYDLCNNPAFGDPMGLHCSHFWGRVNKSVRYEPLNCDACCFACHQHLGGNPQEFCEWKRERLKTIVPDAKFYDFKVHVSPTEGNWSLVGDLFDCLQQKKNSVKQWKKGKIKGKKWDQRDGEVLEYFKKKIQEL